MRRPKKTGPRPLPVPPNWHKPIDDWTLALRAAGRSENTITTRTDHLKRLARAHPVGPWDLTGPALVSWMGSRNWMREGRRNFYASVRGFYNWALSAGHIEESPADQLPFVKAEPPRARPAPEHAYSSALLEADDRERLMLRLAGEAGLRRAEIAQVHARDLFDDLSGWSLVVHGKGGKDREVPLPPYLAAQLRLRAGGGYVFPGDFNGHLSPRWVGKVTTRLLPDDWTIHTLRHRFASVSYAIDSDLMALRDILGHGSVATTQRYIRIADDAKRRLVMSVAGYSQAA